MSNLAAMEHGAHGGKRQSGRRKVARPLDTRAGARLLITLKSRRAKGAWSLQRSANRNWIQEQISALGRRFKVRVYKLELSTDRMQVLISATTREAYQGFLRTLPGTIARHITGARKGKPAGPFWDGLIHSEIISQGRDQ